MRERTTSSLANGSRYDPVYRAVTRAHGVMHFTQAVFKRLKRPSGTSFRLLSLGEKNWLAIA